MAAVNSNGGGAPPGGPTNEELIAAWLETVYLQHTFEDQCECSLTMEEFLNITEMVLPTSWLGRAAMHTAIALLAQKCMRSDVTVLSDDLVHQLYLIGTKKSNTKDVASRLDTPSAILLDDTKRWIIVPCTDGWMYAEKIMPEYHSLHDAAEDGEIAATLRANTSRNRRGRHWGLLIVDKERKTARWLDSMIEIERTKNQKWKVRSIPDAGIAAGKILLGIETFLAESLDTFEKGRRNFTVSTLKHTPQKNRDNTSHDTGASGPFAFEILKFLLKQPPGAMDDIKALFPSSKRKQTKFNSENSRKAMQQLVQTEAEFSADAAFNLEDDIIRALLKPHQLLQAVQESRGEAPPTRLSPIATPDANGPSRPMIQLTRKLGSVWTEEDEIALVEVEKDRRERPEAYKNITDARDALLLFQDYQKALFNDSNGKNAQTIYHARMTLEDLWIRPGYGTLHPAIHKDHSVLGMNDFTWRAIFYVEDGNTFATANEDDCITKWIQDSNVFTMDVDFTCPDDNTIQLEGGVVPAQIRQRMRKQYEESSETTETGTRKPRDDGNDDENSNNGDDSQDEFEHGMQDTFDLSDFNSKSPSTLDGEGPRESTAQTKNTPQGAPGTRKRTIDEDESDLNERTGQSPRPPFKKVKRSPPDFLHLEKEKLTPWINMLPDHVRIYITDPSGNITNEARARTWLERIYHYTFLGLLTNVETGSKNGIDDWRNMWSKHDADSAHALSEDFLRGTLLEDTFTYKPVDGPGVVVEDVVMLLPNYQQNKSKRPREEDW